METERIAPDSAAVPDRAGDSAPARLPWSQRMAESVMRRHTPESARWAYEHGLMLRAVEQVWLRTGDDRYGRFVKSTVDLFVEPDGGIRTYQLADYNLDQINPGKVLFSLYRSTGERRYREALRLLREQLQSQPRTRTGGFWHKRIYPYQMWLDGVYMAGPFLAEYARVFDEPTALDDVAYQILLVGSHTRDPRTGLFYHAWDESKQQRWAHPVTGCSPHFWGRAVGWYAMALVDALDFLSQESPSRGLVLVMLNRLIQAVARVQDPATGLWYQVLDQGSRAGNYLEASASAMFVYAMAKGVRKGYLPETCQEAARAAFAGLVMRFIRVEDSGLVSLAGTCGGAGLGGDPYRDGSYEYYVSEPVVLDDYKGTGPFILGALELEGLGADDALSHP